MTEKIFFATGNPGKVEEMRPHFRERGIMLEQVEVDVEEIDAKDVETVAERKVKDSFAVAREKGEVGEDEVLIVEDTGFYVDAIDGFPGAEASFFASTAGAERILDLLREGEERKAYFETAVAVVHGGEVEVFTGRMEGRVPEGKRGESHPHLPYNSFFVPEGEEESLAENQELKKNEFHRKEATESFLDWFEERNG